MFVRQTKAACYIGTKFHAKHGAVVSYRGTAGATWRKAMRPKIRYLRDDGTEAGGRPYVAIPEKFVLRKEQDQRCNRCMRERGFSEDHIPPQSCGNSGSIAYRRLYADDLATAQATMPSKNGIKYATVCKGCNNGRGFYDAAAAEFVSRLRSIERANIYVPGLIYVPARANAVLRAALAWFVAARLNERECATDAMLRTYLDGGDLAPNIAVHYWPYSGDETIVARDFTSFNVYDGYAIRGTASVIKFAPLAIMLVHGEPVDRLPRLDIHSGAAQRSEMLLRWDRASAPPAHWPERADADGNVVMCGAEFLNAVSSYSGFFGKAMIDEQRRCAASIHAARRIGAPQEYCFVAKDGARRRLYFVR